MDADIKRVDAKLSNEKFVANAPEELVEEEKEKREAAVERKTRIRGAGAAKTRSSALRSPTLDQASQYLAARLCKMVRSRYWMVLENQKLARRPSCRSLKRLHGAIRYPAGRPGTNLAAGIGRDKIGMVFQAHHASAIPLGADNSR